MNKEAVLRCSALASVYKKENPIALKESLQSLVDQTHRIAEVVLVEDGPLTDELYEVIQVYKEKLQLKSVPLLENVGLGQALNKGIEACSYELIVRFDTDDICLPNRFYEQVSFMEANPDIDVCSSHIEEWNESFTHKVGVRKLPTNHDDIVQFGKLRCPISHPAAVYRKTPIQRVGGYPKIFPEDHPLWGLLMMKGYRFANIPKVLVRMRTGDSLIARRGIKFLKGELRIYKYLRGIGYLSARQYWRNVILRTMLRLTPTFIQKRLYKQLREQ